MPSSHHALAAPFQRPRVLIVGCGDIGMRVLQQLTLFRAYRIFALTSQSSRFPEIRAMGAIPIQTATACCDEWFTASGVKVTEITPEGVQKAILAGLELAKNQAMSDLNREIIRTKANAEDVSKIAKRFYEI